MPFCNRNRKPLPLKPPELQDRAKSPIEGRRKIERDVEVPLDLLALVGNHCRLVRGRSPWLRAPP